MENDALLMWYFPHREIFREQIRLSYKPADMGSVAEPIYSANTEEKQY